MSDTVVTRTLLIPAEPAVIMTHLEDLHAWRDWSPWEGLDPDLHREYSGPSSGVGATYAWSGNRKAGAGSMTVLRADDEALDVQVTFTKPFPSKSLSRFRLEPQPSGTLVAWTMTSPQTVMTRIAGLFMNFDKMLGADIEKGLAGLAKVVTVP